MGPLSMDRTTSGGAFFLFVMESSAFTDLRSVHDLDRCFRSLYSSFNYFNLVQSDCFDAAHRSNHNMVVAAPTGCGKTIVMELCVLHLYSQSIDSDGSFRPPMGHAKVIYIAPTRSLVQERVRDWTQRFGSVLNVKVSELTGDIENMRSRDIDDADIVCATPEKFDAVSRKHHDHGGTRFFGDISLVLIDEVHLLNETRGSVLEAGVVSRVRVVSKLESMKQCCISKVRFVAVSATIPNAQDLATWLNVPPDGLMIYGDEVRPVKLRTIVKGYNETKNDFLFERRLNDFLYSVIAEHSNSRPALVFCSTRKGTSDTASHLITQSSYHFANRVGNPFVRDVLHMDRLLDASKKASNKQLQQCLVRGIAFHHAGMDTADRSLVEKYFLNQDILVLCTTGTLAMGVNLPAHLVVIKGTRYYCGTQESALDHNGYKEYDRGMCLQMIGRAGRPQFDTEGIAVIMTQRQHVQRYENLAMGCEELESQLMSCFAEYLNAEIVSGTIKTIPLAVEWLRSTFMYIRAMKNPLLYGIPMATASRQQFDEAMKAKFITSNLQILQKHEMADLMEASFRVVVHGDGRGLSAMECGRLMAYYYIRMNTMIRVSEAPVHASIPDLIHIISKSDELETIRLRRGEKKTLNEINSRRTNPSIKFQVLDGSNRGKVKPRISTAEEKIFILVNDALSETPSDTMDVSLRQEMTQILKVAETITRCMCRYYASIYALASSANARILYKCVKARLWDDSSLQCKQLPNIGKLLSERLAKGGIGKLKQLIQADPRKIESLTMKHYPFGNTLLQDLHKRMPPEVDLHLSLKGVTADGKIMVQITLGRKSEGNLCQAQFMGCSFVCGTIHDDKLLINQPINLKTFPSPYTVGVHVDRHSLNQGPIEVVASVIMETLVGLDVTKKLVIPFDLQSPQWTPQDENRRQNERNHDFDTASEEDRLNNDDGVIQRLSVVVEPESPSKQRTRQLSSRPESNTISAESGHNASQTQETHTRCHTPTKDLTDSEKSGQCSLSGDAMTGHSATRPAVITEHEEMHHGHRIGTQRQNTPANGNTTSSATAVAGSMPPQSLDLNTMDGIRSCGVRSGSTRNTNWRQCLTNVVHPDTDTAMNNKLHPTNKTIRHLRQMDQRRPMDWSSQARVIIDERQRQSSVGRKHREESAFNREVPPLHNMDMKAANAGSTATRVSKRPSSKAVNSCPVNRKHLSTTMTYSEASLPHLKVAENEMMGDSTVKEPRSTRIVRPLSPSKQEEEQTESGTASVFSFL